MQICFVKMINKNSFQPDCRDQLEIAAATVWFSWVPVQEDLKN